MSNRTDQEFEAMACAIAHVAHAGQVDKANQPYIEHPAAVVGILGYSDSQTRARIVGWLHDVVEDSSVTLQTLRAIGFTEEIIEAVRCITHLPGEPLEEYYERVKSNRYAKQVKIADIADNLNEKRLAALDPAVAYRLRAKYAGALKALETVI